MRIRDLAHVVAILLLQEPGALDDLAGKEPGFCNVLAGIVELGPDIEAKRLSRLPLGRDVFQRIVPTGDEVRDDSPIDLLLGGEVVIDVGFGQSRGLGDLGNARAVKALAREYLDPGLDDQAHIAFADTLFRISCCPCHAISPPSRRRFLPDNEAWRRGRFRNCGVFQRNASASPSKKADALVK
ncbi:hypothetical protein D3C87_1497610 [compost metagenome]